MEPLNVKKRRTSPSASSTHLIKKSERIGGKRYTLEIRKDGYKKILTQNN